MGEDLGVVEDLGVRIWGLGEDLGVRIDWGRASMLGGELVY